MTPIDISDMKEAIASLPSDEKLAEIGALALKLVEGHETRDKLLGMLEKWDKYISNIENVQLPELMKKAGQTSMTLENGLIIEVQPVYSCSLGKKDKNGEESDPERKRAALEWMRDNDYGSLIKTKFTLNFGMGEEKEAEMLAIRLGEMKLAFDQKEDVHASTLKSMVTELFESGKEFPTETFGAFAMKVAKIKNKTKKKK